MRRELMIIVAVGVVAVAVAGFVLIKGTGSSRTGDLAAAPQDKSPAAATDTPGKGTTAEPASPPAVIRPVKTEPKPAKLEDRLVKPEGLPAKPEQPALALGTADRSENAASPSPAPLRDPEERTERPFSLQTGLSGTSSDRSPGIEHPQTAGGLKPPASAPAMGASSVLEPPMSAADRISDPLPPARPTPSASGIPAAVRPAPADLKPAPAAETVSQAASGSPSSPAAEGAPIFHTIAPGDTYSSLALKYLGSTKYAGKISEANPDKDPRRLAVGTRIRIPALPQAAKTPAAAQTAKVSPAPAGSTESRAPAATPARPAGTVIPAPPTAPPAIAQGREYRVQPGEGWFDLAQRFLGDGRRWPELYELNRERVARNPSQLRVGTVIELPEGVKVPVSGSTSTTRPG